MENSNNFEKIKNESSKISKEVKEKTFGFIITALSLVAGLAWNEAIQSLIKIFFAIDKDSVWVKFLYAIFLTLALTLITMYLARIFGQENKKENKKVKK